MRAKPPETLDLAAVGKRIRELRGNMRQQELAKRMRISQGQLSKIERGRLAPAAQTLVWLSQEFGKPVDWLLRGDKA
jgi:transcriptional regulator with XRE-family HTH domain